MIKLELTVVLVFEHYLHGNPRRSITQTIHVAIFAVLVVLVWAYQIVVLNLVSDRCISLLTTFFVVKLKKVTIAGDRAHEIVLGDNPVAVYSCLVKSGYGEGVLEGFNIFEEQLIAELDLVPILLLKLNVRHFISMEAKLSSQWISFHRDMNKAIFLVKVDLEHARLSVQQALLGEAIDGDSFFEID